MAPASTTTMLYQTGTNLSIKRTNDYNQRLSNNNNNNNYDGYQQSSSSYVQPQRSNLFHQYYPYDHCNESYRVSKHFLQNLIIIAYLIKMFNLQFCKKNNTIPI